MVITNIRFHEKMPFSDYLALPGLSYSGTKGDGTPFVETDKMRIGTNVHQYLLEPSSYSGENYRIVRSAAKVIHDTIGAALKFGKSEIVVTCTMIVNGLYIFYKGRIDLHCSNIIVDLKVSSIKNLRQAITFFGYNHQLNGYALATKSPVSIMVAIDPKTLVIQKEPIATKCDWWENKVLQHGQPITNAIKDVLSKCQDVSDEAGKISYI
jgi:hypothetical protein